MLRVAFFGTFAHTRYPYADALANCDGMPRSAALGLGAPLELYGETGNKGNMIHGEAPGRWIACDRRRSAYVSVKALVEDGWSAERISAALSKHFDLVVYSTANALRPKVDPGCTADVLDQLTCDFIVLGMGIQNPLPPTTDVLHPELVHLLEVCSRKAKLFGVRGADTERWLHAQGYGGAKAIGCPSMYVYPNNLLALTAPDPGAIRSAMTAGYIYGQVPRAMALLKAFKDTPTHYIMQEEVPLLMDNGMLADQWDIYDDARGELDKAVFDRVLSAVHARDVSFASYRWFQDPSAWRTFAAQCDVYLGDRLHGGVVAMQARVPALLIAEDLRVKELVDFFSIPSLTVADMSGMTLPDLLAAFLSTQDVQRFKDRYLDRFRAFEALFKELEIPLAVRIGQGTDVARTAASRDGRPPAVSKLRRLLTRLRAV